MCGIWGIREEVPYVLDIIKANERRGGYSFGLLNIENGIFEVVRDWQDKWMENYYDDIFRFPHFGQFRAPTTDADKDDFNEEENYPLIYVLRDCSIVFLFGNGVINAECFKEMIKEFGYYGDNDLYYVGLGVLEKGFDFLNKVNGTFALALVVFKGGKIENVYLMRNTFPIYYNDKAYSSVKVTDDMIMLENGIVYDWWNGKKIFKFKPLEIPFLVGGI